MTTIEVDWDVTKAITALRETESVTPNDVLRRVFELPEIAEGPDQGADVATGWRVAGVFFPNGTMFRAEYNGQNYTGKVENGIAIFNGEQAYSPSEAARRITNGARNGWLFWECRVPGDPAWRSINDFRIYKRGKSSSSYLSPN